MCNRRCSADWSMSTDEYKEAFCIGGSFATEECGPSRLQCKCPMMLSIRGRANIVYELRYQGIDISRSKLDHSPRARLHLWAESVNQRDLLRRMAELCAFIQQRCAFSTTPTIKMNVQDYMVCIQEGVYAINWTISIETLTYLGRPVTQRHIPYSI